MNGLYEVSILGSGDNIMMLSLLGNGIKALNDLSTDGYKKSVIDYQNNVKNLRFGYVPGIIRHYFHGSKQNRKYTERWQILINNNFNPDEHLEKDEKGVLIPSKKCPIKLLNDILQYFNERNEDEGFITLTKK